MIPKIAHFYWCGLEMSELRRASYESFAYWNPSWEIAFHEVLWGGENLRSRVVASDIWRYKTLAERGGAYFDTDFLFLKPIPDDWLDADVALTACHGGREVGALSHLFSSPDNPFFRMIHRTCENVVASEDVLDYQSCGTNMLSEMLIRTGMTVKALCESMGLKFKQIDYRLMVPVHPSHQNKLWSRWKLDDDVRAVQWFGCGRLAEEFENEPCGLMRDLLEQHKRRMASCV